MKAVTLYRPRVFENALSDFDRYLDSFFGDSFLTPSDRIFSGIGSPGNSSFQRLPSVDVRETERAYVLEAELPGFDEKEIEVRADGSNLTIASKKETAAETAANENYLIRERRSSSFSRSFRLPENADPGAISASFRNGIISFSSSRLLVIPVLASSIKYRTI